MSAPDGPLGAGRAVGSFALLDLDRRRRTGVPEAVFAEGKSDEQTLQLLAALRAGDASAPALATRCPPGVLAAAADRFAGEDVLVDEPGRVVVVGALPAPRGAVAVLTGGTSDLPVAQECLSTLAALGVGARLVADVGVAGLGRLLARVEELHDVDCVVALAGMEGALPTVVAGLVAAPVVAVPTSVGYGVGTGGLVAAAAMLSSCSPGIGVVNVDNGFGAAVLAAKVVGRVARAR